MFGTLKIWHKLVLMMVPPAAAASLLGALLVRTDHQQVIASRAEIAAARYLRVVPALLRPLEMHATSVALALGGDATAPQRVSETAAAVDNAFTLLASATPPGRGSAETRRRVEALRAAWASLRDTALSLSALDSEMKHKSLALSVVNLGQQVADSSGLSQTAVQEGQRLTQALVVWMPRVIVNLSTVRARGTAITARRGAFADDVLLVTSLLENVREAEREADDQLQAAFDANPHLRAALLGLSNRARQITAGYAELAHRRLRSAAVDLSSQEHGRVASQALDESFRLYDATLRSLTEMLAARARAAELRRNIVAAATVVGLILAVVSAWWVSGDVRRQVAAIKQALAGVERGRLDARADVLTDDELGALAASMNAMFDNTLTLIQSREHRDRMQASIVKLLDEVSGVGEGDLTREAEVTADATGAIADSFNLMIAQLRQIIGHVKRTSIFVGDSAVDIHDTAARLAAASERQSSQITETSAAVAEMALSIHAVSEHAATAAAVADQGRTSAEHGAKAVLRTREGMDVIRERVQQTALRIKRLGENAQEIGEIVQLIGDLADRTSILALNASIQAAAAGPAGRGFAVVAEEVERLAERAGDATKRIATLIKTTQTETAGALEAMEDTTREVVSGSVLAAEAADALGEIEQVSNRLAELLVSISSASKRQAGGSEIVARSMHSIALIAQQTAPEAKAAAESVARLAEHSDALRASVLRFKLPDADPAAARDAA